MLTYVPSLSASFLDSGSSASCTLMQGAVLSDSDLNVVFINNDGLDFSPFSLAYSVGFFSEDSSFHTVGSTSRIPLKLREGRFRPNFQVGDTWYTGNYQIVWSYRVTASSEVKTRETPFTVVTAGLYDNKPLPVGYQDVSATIIIEA